jgi:hypothetical protein
MMKHSFCAAQQCRKREADVRGVRTSDKAIISAACQTYKRGQQVWLCKDHYRAAQKATNTSSAFTTRPQQQQQAQRDHVPPPLIPNIDSHDDIQYPAALPPSSNNNNVHNTGTCKGKRFDRLIANGSHTEVLATLHVLAASKKKAMRLISQLSAAKQRMSAKHRRAAASLRAAIIRLRHQNARLHTEVARHAQVR